MKRHSVLIVLSFFITVGWVDFSATQHLFPQSRRPLQRPIDRGSERLTGRGLETAPTEPQTIADEIIALEKASVEAWKRRDKTFYADYWADDFTMFLPQNPYLDADAKTNTLSKFEQKTEQWKLIDLQIYNPLVRVYGDVAVLTYNEAVEGLSDGRPTSYTGKVTMIYRRQGGKWRGIHYHESENRATR